MLNYQDHTVVTVGSHSALDICRGAKDEGFKTLVIVEKGRDKTYTNYFKSAGALGCVDEVLYVEKVKVLEKERGFERAFFIINSVDQYNIESERLIKEKKIAKEALKKAVIEEFILGVQVNFNFFFSPLSDRLELLGTDTRRQTNLDGFIRLPGLYQPQVRKNITYEEAGHIAVTILESMLEPAFEIGEKFVKATEQMVKPGVIGPF